MPCSTFARAGALHIMLLTGLIVLAGVVSSSASWGGGSLRAARSESQRQQQGEVAAELDWARSLLSTRSPACTLPEADPCTLNTTAIGMVEAGFATYYDGGCAEKGFNGCFTDGIPECRTCYLSKTLYLEATNATEKTLPNWGDCPCCVPTTLEAEHPDLEVNIFDYSIFNISVTECTDAPTASPTFPPTAAPAPTPAPTAIVETPTPTMAPVASTEDPVPVTPAPSASSSIAAGAELTPSPAPDTPRDLDLGSPAPSAASISSDGSGQNDDVASRAGLDTAEDSSDGGLSTGAKIGIGVGAAVGVIIVGGAVFGAFKASGRGAA